jgi:phosphoketolase
MRTAAAHDSQPKASNLDLPDRYWRAANYLSVGQIYLLDIALLHEPLRQNTLSHDCSDIGEPLRALNFIRPI